MKTSDLSPCFVYCYHIPWTQYHVHSHLITFRRQLITDLIQGNHYCARDYGESASNPNTYHYSNQDGSYYYSNPNGSTYYNDGKGQSTYTPPAKKN
ncbi:hypothetical protein V8E54_010338 [Elaphomyces granulatus]